MHTNEAAGRLRTAPGPVLSPSLRRKALPDGADSPVSPERREGLRTSHLARCFNSELLEQGGEIPRALTAELSEAMREADQIFGQRMSETVAACRPVACTPGTVPV